MKTLEKQNADLVSNILVAEPFQPELRKAKGDGRARQAQFGASGAAVVGGIAAGAGAGIAAAYDSRDNPGIKKNFNEAEHPRGQGGKFTSGGHSARGRAVIAALPDRVRFGSPAPSMRSAQDSTVLSSPPIRSPMRNSSVWRTGSKLPGLPREYTGSPDNERTAGTFEHIELRQQIPRKMPVADHMDRLRHLSDTIRDSRAEILANADKNRKGKKHVYLKSNEAATKRLYGGVAQWRMKPDLYPEGTPRSSLNRAYNHGAMLALHDFGLVHYDFKMDDHLKQEMTPLIPMIRYVRRSLGHKLAIARPGQNHQYINEFGTPYPSGKTHRVGPMAGKPRLRVAPREQLVKRYGAAIGAFGRRVGASVSNGLNGAADAALSGTTPNFIDRISSLAARRATFIGPGDLKGAARGFGHAVGQGTAAVIHHPIKTAKRLIREGADFGAHLGSGLAEGYGASPKNVRRSAKVGAAIGATKIAVVPAAIAYHPAVRALAAMRARRNQQAKPGAIS